METENIEKPYFIVNRNTEARQLYNFINNYLTFNEVVELYRLLRFKMEHNVDMEQVNNFMEGYEE